MLSNALEKKKPTISLTPLIDVVFILLIFFMLVVHFKSYQQIPLRIAQATQVNIEQNKIEYVSIKLTATDSCYLDDTETPCDTLASSIKKDRSVLLRFEAEVELGAILSVYQQLIAADLKVQMATGFNASENSNAL